MIKEVSITSTKTKYELYKRSGFIIASFVVPIIIMLVVGLINGLFPVFGGKNALLASDINNQFTAFYSYFKNVIISDDDFIYTFSKCLGGDMLGMSAYYLHNPFLFLLFLFKDKDIVIGIFVIEIIQIGLMGLTFFLFITNETGLRLSNLIFSTCYALMGFSLAYIVLPIYFNCLWIFPLVILGINKLIEDDNCFLLYVLSLAFSIWCNYYQGYMICIFVALYVVNRVLTGKITNLKKFIRVLVFSFAGVLLAAFDLVPTVLSISGTKDAPTNDIFVFDILYKPSDLLRNMLPATFTGNLSNDCAPYIYVGTIVLVCLILYLLSKRQSRREIILNIVFLFVLIISSMISGFDVVWHGFNAPVGFAHRFAFLISFYMIWLGAVGFDSVVSKESYIRCRFLDNARTIIALTMVIFAIQCIELGINANKCIEVYLQESVDKTENDEYYEKTLWAINKIKTENNGFYRIEKDFEKNHNDSMEFSYAGLSHNSSCEKDYVKTFMGRMGYRNQGIWAFYNQGSTNFADCFLGVRYFISRFDSTNKLFSYFTDEGDYHIFENPFTLPLGFVTENSIAVIDMEGEDPFYKQNQIARSFGFDSDIYINVNDEVSTSNLSVKEDVYIEPSTQSGTYTKGDYLANVYEKINADENARLSYIVPVDRNCNLYCYFSAPYEQGCELYINGEHQGDYFSDFRWSIINLGKYREGDTVEVDLELTGDNLSIYDAYFYEEDIYNLYNWSLTAMSSNVNLQKITSSSLVGEVAADKDGLLVFSIPFEEDWQVRLDGEKVSTSMVLDCLMSVPIDKGEHILEMKYVPRGRSFGIVVSFITLLFLLIVAMKKNRLFFWREDFREEYNLNGQ